MPGPQEIVAHANDATSAGTSSSYEQAAANLMLEVQGLRATNPTAHTEVYNGLVAANLLPEISFGHVSSNFGTIAALDGSSDSISRDDLTAYIAQTQATNPMAAALATAFRDNYLAAAADINDIYSGYGDNTLTATEFELDMRMEYLSHESSAQTVMDMLLQERDGGGNMFEILEEFRMYGNIFDPGNDHQMSRDDVEAAINELVDGEGTFYDWVQDNVGTTQPVLNNLMWLRDNWDSLALSMAGFDDRMTPDEIASGLGLPGVDNYEQYKTYRAANPLTQAQVAPDAPVVVQPVVTPVDTVTPVTTPTTASQSALRASITSDIQALPAGERLQLLGNRTFFDANGNFIPPPADPTAWNAAKNALPPNSLAIITELQGYSTSYGAVDVDTFIQQGLVPQTTDTATTPQGDMATFMSTNQVTQLGQGEHMWQVAQRALKARGIDVKFGDPQIQAEVERIMVLNGYRSSDGSTPGKNWNSISANQQFLIYGPNDTAITSALAAALANGTAHLVNGEIVMSPVPVS